MKKNMTLHKVNQIQHNEAFKEYFLTTVESKETHKIYWTKVTFIWLFNMVLVKIIILEF